MTLSKNYLPEGDNFEKSYAKSFVWPSDVICQKALPSERGCVTLKPSVRSAFFKHLMPCAPQQFGLSWLGRVPLVARDGKEEVAGNEQAQSQEASVPISIKWRKYYMFDKMPHFHSKELTLHHHPCSCLVVNFSQTKKKIVTYALQSTKIVSIPRNQLFFVLISLYWNTLPILCNF